jgi:plastocyanin
MRTTRLRRRLAVGLLATALVLAAAACGDDDDSDLGATVPAGSDVDDGPAGGGAGDEGSDAIRTLDVVGADFSFEGVPSELSAGTYEVTFTNEGTELHEVFIFQNPEGIPLQELFDLGPEEGMSKIVPVMEMPLFAQPGASAPAPAVIELEPGEYEVVCFIPTPTDGNPHFHHGMHTTITVS